MRLAFTTVSVFYMMSLKRSLYFSSSLSSDFLRLMGWIAIIMMG